MNQFNSVLLNDTILQVDVHTDTVSIQFHTIPVFTA